MPAEAQAANQTLKVGVINPTEAHCPQSDTQTDAKASGELKSFTHSALTQPMLPMPDSLLSYPKCHLVLQKLQVVNTITNCKGSY